MPKAFLVKKFKATKWSTGYQESKIKRKHVAETKIKKEDDKSKIADAETLMFFAKEPFIDLHHSNTVVLHNCLQDMHVKPKARVSASNRTVAGKLVEDNSGKKAKKCETKKPRNFSSQNNVNNRPLILPNEKFEFPKPSGPLPQTQYICQLCKEVYPDPFALAQHGCSGIKHTEYRCPECDKVFSCPANLASHRRWHRPRSPNQAKSKAVQKQRIMKSEETMEEREDEEDVAIPSPTKSDSSNNNDGEYSCDLCDKSFRRKTYLQKHMNSHNDRPYQCQLCGKVFRTLTNRAKHVLNHAVGTKTFSCQVCGNCFPNRGSLDRHSRIHNNQVYSCEHCSAIFYSVPGLTRHAAKCRQTTTA